MPVSVVLALTVIPLLLPLLPLRNVTRAQLWVGMLSLFYFCHGVVEAWSLASASGGHGVVFRGRCHASNAAACPPSSVVMKRIA